MKNRKRMFFFNKGFYATLLVSLFLVSSLTTAIAHDQHPNTLINAEEIAAIKAKITITEDSGVITVTGEEPWRSAAEKMMRQAKAALGISAPYFSVTYGGDNSNLANCANVRIYCTGKFYDGNNQYDSNNGAIPVTEAVRDLGMAYAFSGEAKYADKLIQLVRTWALDEKTGMLPRFSNNQSRIGLFPTMSGFIYGVDLAWNYPGWLDADRVAFKAWVSTFANNAKDLGIPQNPQNFVNWRIAFVSIAGAFTGEQALLDFAFDLFKEIIPGQISGDGRLGQESGRNNKGSWGGIGYSVYAMHAMTLAAEVARHQGVDLYNYTSNGEVGGKGLRLVLDYHVPYLAKPVPGGNPFAVGENPVILNGKHGLGIYELAYSQWQDPEHLSVLEFWGRPFEMRFWALGIVTLTHANRFELDLVPKPLSIISQPENVTVTEGGNATFSVVATGSGSLSYQWYFNGAEIVGATSASYTLTGVSAADVGSYGCSVTNAEGDASCIDASLEVTVDDIAPTLVSASATSATGVEIIFSEAVEQSSAENQSNYQLDLGISVTSAVLNEDGRTVSLVVTPAFLEDTTYMVSVSNVKDLAQDSNTIAALSSKTFTYRTADDFEDGVADGWTPYNDNGNVNVNRWEVIEDEGDMAYFLNDTTYANLGGKRLGEYSLLAAQYADFTFTAQAKLGDDVASNALADYAVVFGFQDNKNYYYAMFNNDKTATTLFKVVDGTREKLAAASDASTTDWLTDNLYHSIKVSRMGSEIKVYFDNKLIMNVNDDRFGAGQVGVGSYNDSAYFDDVKVVGKVTITPDTTPPVITLIGNNPQTITLGDAYTELGAKAEDNVDGDISGQIIIDDSAVNTDAVGSYEVTYNVKDDAGNTALEITRVVKVMAAGGVDNIAPVITLNGNASITITVDGVYVEAGAIALDNLDGDISGKIIIDDSAVDTSIVGTYEITYNVSDEAGNAATPMIRTVNIIAATVISVSALGGPLLAGLGLMLLAFRLRRQC